MQVFKEPVRLELHRGAAVCEGQPRRQLSDHRPHLGHWIDDLRPAREYTRVRARVVQRDSGRAERLAPDDGRHGPLIVRGDGLT